MAAQERRSTRRMREGAITFLLMVLNLFALNVLSEHHYVRWDLTEDGRYTLSPETLRVLNNLDDLVTVKYFVSDDLPPSGRELRSRTKDLLEEFRTAAEGKLQVICLDPTGNLEVRSEAQQYGIPELPLQQYGSDSYEAKMAYLGLAVLYEDRVETLPAVLDTGHLEYDLLMSIVRVMERKKPVVAFFQRGAALPPENLSPELRAQWVARHGVRDRHDPARDYSRMAADLRKRYRLERVDLSVPVPEEVTTLVAANAERMDVRACYHLDQFLMRGGKVLLLMPGVLVDLDHMRAGARGDELDEFLAHYGIRVDKNLILDHPHCASVEVTREVGGMRVPVRRPYPPYLLIGAEGLDPESPVTRALRSLTLAFCSSIHLDPSEGTEARILLRSSPTAWQEKDRFILDPDRIVPAPPEARRSFDLAGILEGEFISFFAARPVPEEVTGAGPEAAQARGFEGKERDEEEGRKGGTGRGDDLNHPPGMRLRSLRTALLVVGSDGFVSNSAYGGSTAVFFANAVDYLTRGEGFGEIRNRASTERLIDPRFRDDLPAVNLLKVIGTLGGGALVLFLGLILFFRRRLLEKREVTL